MMQSPDQEPLHSWDGFKAAQELGRQMKNTARARFNAAKRLESHDRHLTALTAFTSAYLIIFTALPYFLDIPEPLVDQINLFAISLAVIILVSSLLQYSGGAVSIAEQHHRSGLEINELHREVFAYENDLTQPQYIIYASRYNSILQKYSVNHDDVDYIRLQIARPEDFSWIKGWPRLFMQLKILVLSSLPLGSLLVITTLSLWLVLGVALPNQTHSKEPSSAGAAAKAG